MKAIHYLACGLMVLALSGGISSFGQAKPGMQHMDMKGKPGFHMDWGMMIPNLTDQQKDKIKELRLTHMEEMMQLQNELGELKAKQRTLATADKPDMKAIDGNIDDISKVLDKMMKSKAHFKQQVRALLTDEQRIYFDMHGMRNMGNTWMHGNQSCDRMGFHGQGKGMPADCPFRK